MSDLRTPLTYGELDTRIRARVFKAAGRVDTHPSANTYEYYMKRSAVEELINDLINILAEEQKKWLAPERMFVDVDPIN